MTDLEQEVLRLLGDGFNCSQIVLKLGLELTGEDRPELVRMAQGLGHGIGAGEVCGALLGGICLLSWHCGRGSDEETKHPMFDAILSDLVTWFQESACASYNSIRCGDILEDSGGTPHFERCAGLTAGAYEKAVEILQQYEIDPTLPPEARHA
ncbi:DVU_1555 family C-GCAxxG-C-C protein [Megalodesulfovibrio paquesii]